MNTLQMPQTADDTNNRPAIEECGSANEERGSANEDNGLSQGFGQSSPICSTRKRPFYFHFRFYGPNLNMLQNNKKPATLWNAGHDYVSDEDSFPTQVFAKRFHDSSEQLPDRSDSSITFCTLTKERPAAAYVTPPPIVHIKLPPPKPRASATLRRCLGIRGAGEDK